MPDTCRKLCQQVRAALCPLQNLQVSAQPGEEQVCPCCCRTEIANNHAGLATGFYFTGRPGKNLTLRAQFGREFVNTSSRRLGEQEAHTGRRARDMVPICCQPPGPKGGRAGGSCSFTARTQLGVHTFS